MSAITPWTDMSLPSCEVRKVPGMDLLGSDDHARQNACAEGIQECYCGGEWPATSLRIALIPRGARP